MAEEKNETKFILNITERKFIVAWSLVVLLIILFWSMACMSIGYFWGSRFGNGMKIEHYHAGEYDSGPMSNMPQTVPDKKVKEK